MKLPALALSLAWLPPAEAGPETEPPFQERVDQAIVSGLNWLRRAREDTDPAGLDHSPYSRGVDCLLLYTLLVSGVPRNDPLVLQLVDEARLAADLSPHTYTAAFALLGLASHDRVRHGALIAKLVARISAGQFHHGDREAIGAWGYLVPLERTGPGRPEQQFRTSHWDAPARWWDDSNTQYAVLALRGAVDFGFQVDARVFEDAARHFILRQNGDGGFAYSPQSRSDSYLSMTAGACGSLLMCLDLLGEDREAAAMRQRADKVLQRGRNWMGAHLRFPPLDSPWPFYAAYAVERMGHYSGLDRFGGRDWYRDGAEWLIRVRHADGFWSNDAVLASGSAPGSRLADAAPLVDTCFALLFLKRASAVHTLASDEVLVLLRGIDPQSRPADLTAVKARIQQAGVAAAPQLVRGLYLPTAAARKLADECLRELTGQDMGYPAAVDEADERRARERWVQWLLAHPMYDD